MGRGAARIDQEMPGRMARRNINMHYGTTDSGPQLPPHYSGNITWIRGTRAKSLFQRQFIVQQENNTTQGLVCSKSRLARHQI